MMVWTIGDLIALTMLILVALVYLGAILYRKFQRIFR